MRLDEVKRQLGDRVAIEWKSFLLRVEPKTGDREKFIEYTKSWLNPAEQEPATNFTLWSSDEDQPSSSVPAQVAHKAVTQLDPDKAMDYHHRLLTAYFTENRNIADSETLLDLAAEVGVDRDALAELARDQQDVLAAQVIEEHNGAINAQVTAVPTVVLEHAFGVPGAQPVETYIRLIERIEEKRSA